MEQQDGRGELLIHMYDQLWGSMNTRTLLVWQSIGVIAGALAVLALVSTGVIGVTIATALLLLMGIWGVAHTLDAAYWYNRNLAVITNIERLFLGSADLRDVHYYFGRHRSNRPIASFRIQLHFLAGITLVVLAWHCVSVLTELACRIPLYSRSPSLDGLTGVVLSVVRFSVPILLALSGAWYLYGLYQGHRRKYEEFIKNSPGQEVDIAGIRYGAGHGYEE